MPPLLDALAILLLNGLPVGAAEEPAIDPLSPAALAEQIDTAFKQHWKEQGLRPAEQIDDPTFLRRLSLDLLGTIPSREEARAFQKDSSEDKRSDKIREYLDHPAAADG